jgi:hypothetical protein
MVLFTFLSKFFGLSRAIFTEKVKNFVCIMIQFWFLLAYFLLGA